ncbi:hypothetical protein M0R45_034599 [Rubus argutus]|uniref:Uncharacterized protein n=1 Tax=Rubus argutus TaxID=59490 RepID=A0AAW1VQM0_RUBAR
MAKFRDRMEDFKDDVRHAAISSGYNEVLQLIPIKTLESIGALEQFMLKHRKNYVDFHRTIERETDSIEQHELFQQTTLLRITHITKLCAFAFTCCSLFFQSVFICCFIKLCQEQIDVLKNSNNDDEAKSNGWLGIEANRSNADTLAHKHGVV